ncbi:hypothetical protein [Acholeplasma oculi]|nr:hypothetical protein [Acholeplasma oculi]
MNRLKQNDLYVSLSKKVETLGFKLFCDFGKEKDSTKSNNLYISISILNKKNELIEIWDEGFLTIATILVFIDRKERIKFFSWKDKEFLEDIYWIINQLDNYQKKV